MFNCFPNCSLIYTPISNFEETVSLPPFRHLILQNLKIFTNQMGAKSHLIAVLICTSLITDNVEHLFIFLLILSVSCSVKCFLCHSSFFFFSVGLLVLFLICGSYFYVFLTLILPWLCVLQRPIPSL